VIFKSEVVRLFLEYGVQNFLMTALCSHFYFYTTYEMSDEMNLQCSAVAPSCLIDPKHSTIFDDGLYVILFLRRNLQNSIGSELSHCVTNCSNQTL
jgi:hypothetical protein